MHLQTVATGPVATGHGHEHTGAGILDLMTTVEVFADICCPFTHVGLRLVTNQLARLDTVIECRVRAWPLEWVNGEPMTGEAVAEKVAVLRDELGSMYFEGFDADEFPTTTVPAMSLASVAYERDMETGLAVSLEVRDALFERGLDVSKPDVLEAIAQVHGLEAWVAGAMAGVEADYEAGKARGVTGSPHFFAGDREFFCPTLDLARDDEGALHAAIDIEGLNSFVGHLASL